MSKLGLFCDPKIPVECDLRMTYNWTNGEPVMPEVTADYFKNPSKYHESPPDVGSEEAPRRPIALDGEILAPQTLVVQEEPENSVPHILRTIDITKLEGRADFIRSLTLGIPENEFNLPQYIYRADFLDVSWIGRNDWPTNIQDTLAAATVYLNYEQGFPIFRNGMPFWAKMDYESVEAYTAFTKYLEQPGARTFHGMPEFVPDLLVEWHSTYYWSYRARAYDLFKAAHHQRMREQRILGMQDSHYTQAEKVLGRVTKAIESISDEDLKEVGADKLVGMLDRLVKVQRISVGLSAQGANTDADTAKSTSFELAIRQVANNSGATRKDNDSAETDMLLSDPEALMQAQELILKVNHK